MEFSFSVFFSLFKILIKKFFKHIIILSTFFSLSVFPTVLFPLQLIFNMCKSSLKVKVKFAQSYLTLCDLVDIQSMEFSRPEYWSV